MCLHKNKHVGTQMIEQKNQKITLLSVKDVMNIFGSRSTIHNMRSEGLLPEPVSPYGNRVMWASHEIDQVLRLIASGMDRESIKEKVKLIVEARKELAS